MSLVELLRNNSNLELISCSTYNARSLSVNKEHFLNKKSGYIEETRGWLCLSFLYKGFRCRRNYRRDFVFFFLRSKYAASSLMPQMADMTKIGIKAIAHRNVMVSFRWYLPV